MKEWVNTHPHDPMLLTMHDCTVTRIDLETSEDSTRMIWHLPDGIWVAPEIAGEGITKTCRTAEACAVFEAKHPDTEWDQEASICIKSRWHGKDKRMNTETWAYVTVPELAQAMQKDGWSLEIVSTYTEGRIFLVTGEIHTPKERRWRQFRMTFTAETASYFWDAIRPDRVW